MVEKSFKTTFIYLFIYLYYYWVVLKRKSSRCGKSTTKKKGATLDSFNPYKVWKPKCE
jgi:hypothetical protein